MTKQQLTNEQFYSICEQFSELVVDSMDMKDLVNYVYEHFNEFYQDCSVNELKEYVNNYDEDLWEELLDNEGIKGEVDDSLQTTTYSLNVNESITFPCSSS
jgi:formylmethanofuran dehydrogenase subunit E-like metal-binding protein